VPTVSFVPPGVVPPGLVAAAALVVVVAPGVELAGVLDVAGVCCTVIVFVEPPQAASTSASNPTRTDAPVRRTKVILPRRPGLCQSEVDGRHPCLAVALACDLGKLGVDSVEVLVGQLDEASWR
jgi:hypothetical protein